MSERAVIVTTKHRGVFFGYVTGETLGKRALRLLRARNCVYWSAATKGFVGLSVTGPADGSRVGPATPSLDVSNVTSVADCTEEAVQRWESAPWTS